MTKFKITKKLFDKKGKEFGEQFHYLEAASLEDARERELARQDVIVEEVNQINIKQ